MEALGTSCSVVVLLPKLCRSHPIHTDTPMRTTRVRKQKFRFAFNAYFKNFRAGKDNGKEKLAGYIGNEILIPSDSFLL